MAKENIVQLGLRCSRCGERDPAKFYKTYSDIYTINGYMPICRDCLNKLYDNYLVKYGDSKKAMQRVCMALDLYYKDSIVDSAENAGRGNFIGNYVRALNMKQFRGKTYDWALKEGLEFNKKPEPKKASTKEKAKEKEKEPEEPVKKEDVDKWGAGFDAVDYRILNSHYKLLKAANPNCDTNQEIFITDLCYAKMQQMKAVREGNVDNYSKLTESYRKLFQQAGLKTVKDNSMNEGFLMGVTAETIEKYTPAEYYKNKKLYKDSDDLGSYVWRFMLRPLKNLQHGSKDRDFEYYVKEEDDSDEYSEE